MARLSLQRIAPLITAAGILTSGLVGPAEAKLDPFPGASMERARLTVEAEVFAGYLARTRSAGGDDTAFDAFVLDRAELGTDFRAATGLGVDLRLEAIRTAVGGSYTGVAGDSLVLRVRRARGYWSTELGPVGLDIEAGLLTEPFLAALLPRFHLRATGALLAESAGLFDANELGASLAFRLWRDREMDGDRVVVQLAATNGEGRAEREQNTDKDLTARLTYQMPVVALQGAPLVVGVHGVYRRGRVGPAAETARNDRVGGAVSIDHPLYGLGAMYLRGDGFAGRSGDQAEAFEVWLDARPVAEWPGLVARWWQLGQKPDVGNVSTRRALTAGLFADLDTLLPGLAQARLFALYDQEEADAEAAAVPGTAETITGFRVVLEARGIGRF